MKVFSAPFFLAVLATQTLCVNATIIRRQTGSCSGQQVNSFIATLPQACQDAINNFTVDVVGTICARDCYGVLTDYIENTCNDATIARVNRAQCSRGDATVDYCYPIVVNQSVYSATRALLNPCGNSSDMCTASCPAALQALATSVGCCWAELVYVNPDSTVTYTTANEWANCGVTFPGECANPFTTEAATTPTDSMATAATDSMTTAADSVATASAEGLLVTEALVVVIYFVYHIVC